MDEHLYDSTAAHGKELAKPIANHVSRQLMAMTSPLMSGEDSGLKNVWDEICVQVQDEHSVFWSAYVDVIEGCILAELEPLKRLELDALWLCTEQGLEWAFEERSEPRPFPGHSLDEITTYILDEHLLPMAAYWSNARIRRYMEREYD